MLTARDQVADRVAGLDAGADDYLVKPFASRSCSPACARCAGLRMAPSTCASPTSGSTPRRGGRRDGEPIELTRTEFSLLELFLLNPRQVLTRSLIFERVWGYDFGFGSNSLDVYRLPAPQDGAGRAAAADPDDPRRRLRAART